MMKCYESNDEINNILGICHNNESYSTPCFHIFRPSVMLPPIIL